MTKHNQHVAPRKGSFTILGRNFNVGRITSSLLLGGAVVFSFLMLSLTGSAAPDKLSDFKEAAAKDGCMAIPYQTERNECDTRSKAKERICVDFSCDRPQVEKDLQTYKEKYQNLQNARSRNDEQSVRSLEVMVKDLEDKLKAHVATAKERIDRGYNCLAARENVQRSFSDAKEMVTKDGEKDATLLPYVPDLVRKYEQGRATHIQPMQDTTSAISGCTWVKEITW